MQAYETIFILTPVLSEEQVKDTAEKFLQFLQEKQATILHKEFMGLKTLAYPIKGKTLGFYYSIEFSAGGQAIRELETQYLRDERIIRYLTVSLDKHALTYKEKCRTQSKENSKEEETQVTRP